MKKFVIILLIAAIAVQINARPEDAKDDKKDDKAKDAAKDVKGAADKAEGAAKDAAKGAKDKADDAKKPPLGLVQMFGAIGESLLNTGEKVVEGVFGIPNFFRK